jgi:hypothetical protein
MGARPNNEPFRYNNVEDFVQSVNQFNISSQDKNQIKINSINVSVNGKEINYKINNYSFKDETKDKTKTEENYGQAFMSIFIKSEFGTIQLQVNSSDKVGDVIEKYKCKLQKDNIKSIYFYKEGNILMNSNRKLEEFKIQNNSQINAKIEFNNNINNTYVTYNENIKMKNKAYSNSEIPPDKLSELKKEIKEKNKQGLRAIVIKSSTQKTEFFYVKPDVKFKIIAEKYKKINPDNEWIFLFNGALIIDTEKTIEELKMKNLSVIVAHCN